jgi:hypothetical protein
MSFSLSKTVVSLEGEQLYTFEYAALIAETSVTVVTSYVELGVIEPIGNMLHSREIARIAQLQRLLDMAQEIAQLRAQLRAHQSHPPNAL